MSHHTTTIGRQHERDRENVKEQKCPGHLHKREWKRCRQELAHANNQEKEEGEKRLATISTRIPFHQPRLTRSIPPCNYQR